MSTRAEIAWKRVYEAGPYWLAEVVEDWDVRLGGAALIAAVHTAGTEGLKISKFDLISRINDLVEVRMMTAESEIHRIISELERMEIIHVQRTPGSSHRYTLLTDPDEIVDPELIDAVAAECDVLAAVENLFRTHGTEHAVAVLNAAILARTGAIA